MKQNVEEQTIMEIKLKIKTPPGQAQASMNKLRPFLLGLTKTKEAYVNKDDSQIVWVIDTDIKRALSIQANASRFDFVMKNMLGNKHIQKMCNKEDLPKLKDMLTNQTKVEVIKKASLEDMDYSNKTFWQKIVSA